MCGQELQAEVACGDGAGDTRWQPGILQCPSSASYRGPISGTTQTVCVWGLNPKQGPCSHCWAMHCCHPVPRLTPSTVSPLRAGKELSLSPEDAGWMDRHTAVLGHPRGLCASSEAVWGQRMPLATHPPEQIGHVPVPLLSPLSRQLWAPTCPPALDGLEVAAGVLQSRGNTQGWPCFWSCPPRGTAPGKEQGPSCLGSCRVTCPQSCVLAACSLAAGGF